MNRVAPAGDLDGRRARTRLDEVLRLHFDASPEHVRRLAGGLNNVVYAARVAGRDVIVRLHTDGAKVHQYLKERWAADRAREVGVPVAEVLEVGTAPGGQAYMIVDRVDGIPGIRHADRLKMLDELGRLAARLHRVRTHGFGPMFDWSSNRLSQQPRWSDVLDREFDASRRLDWLARQGVLTDGGLKTLQRDLAAMRGWRKRPALQHGDLRLKNLVVDPASGRILAVVDWEDCMSAPPPFWDFANALHDLGVDEKEAFLHGYGITPARFANLAPFLRTLNALNYAWAMQCAIDAGERGRAAWLRARLRGVFDLAPALRRG